MSQVLFKVFKTWDINGIFNSKTCFDHKKDQKRRIMICILETITSFNFTSKLIGQQASWKNITKEKQIIFVFSVQMIFIYIWKALMLADSRPQTVQLRTSPLSSSALLEKWHKRMKITLDCSLISLWSNWRFSKSIFFAMEVTIKIVYLNVTATSCWSISSLNDIRQQGWEESADRELYTGFYSNL